MKTLNTLTFDEKRALAKLFILIRKYNKTERTALEILSDKLDSHISKINKQTRIINRIDSKFTPVLNEGAAALEPLDMYGFERWRND